MRTPGQKFWKLPSVTSFWCWMDTWRDLREVYSHSEPTTWMSSLIILLVDMGYLSHPEYNIFYGSSLNNASYD